MHKHVQVYSYWYVHIYIYIKNYIYIYIYVSNPQPFNLNPKPCSGNFFDPPSQIYLRFSRALWPFCTFRALNLMDLSSKLFLVIVWMDPLLRYN